MIGSKENPINLDWYLLEENSSPVLIILAKTGVYYTAQVGGISCHHTIIEGFHLPNMPTFHFEEDCEFGCSYLNKHYYQKGEMLDALQKLTEAFDEKAKQFFDLNDDGKYGYKFDHSRAFETMEGWIPVELYGQLADGSVDGLKGFIHTGNCD